MTSCSSAILPKKHTVDHVLITWRFSHALLQENFTSNFWFLSRVEARNFTKNKLLKLVNSTKTDFLFSELNLNLIIQKKNARKMHVLWMIL